MVKIYSSGILRVSRPPGATSGAVMVSCYSVYCEKDGLVSLFLHSDKCSKKLYNLLYNNSNSGEYTLTLLTVTGYLEIQMGRYNTLLK